MNPPREYEEVDFPPRGSTHVAPGVWETASIHPYSCHQCRVFIIPRSLFYVREGNGHRLVQCKRCYRHGKNTQRRLVEF